MLHCQILPDCKCCGWCKAKFWKTYLRNPGISREHHSAHTKKKNIHTPPNGFVYVCVEYGAAKSMFDCLRKSLSWSKMESCFEHWYALCWNKQVGYIDNCLGVPRVLIFGIRVLIYTYATCTTKMVAANIAYDLPFDLDLGGYHSDSRWIKITG